MRESIDHLQTRMKSEGDKIVSFFRQIDELGWERVIYQGDPQWTLFHVLKHFVSVEQAFQWLIQDVLEGGMGAPEDFVIDEFNQAEVGRFSEYQPAEMVETFQQLRNDSISLAGTLRSEDLQRRGNHPYFGHTTLKKILKLLYTHNNMHMRDVRRALRREPEVKQ